MSIGYCEHWCIRECECCLVDVQDAREPLVPTRDAPGRLWTAAEIWGRRRLA